MQKCDMLVIGTGPAGLKAAIQAAKLGRKVIITERKEVVGGVCINTGTIPSKMREAVLYLTGYGLHNLYGHHTVKSDVTMSTRSCARIMSSSANRRHPRPDAARRHHDGGETSHRAEHVARQGLTATSEVEADKSSSRARARRHPAWKPTARSHSDDLLLLKELPKTMTAVGAGVIGTSMPRCSPCSACASRSSTNGRSCSTSSTTRSSRR
jgi:NAD(P) transhydrogenase